MPKERRLRWRFILQVRLPFAQRSVSPSTHPLCWSHLRHTEVFFRVGCGIAPCVEDMHIDMAHMMQIWRITDRTRWRGRGRARILHKWTYVYIYIYIYPLVQVPCASLGSIGFGWRLTGQVGPSCILVWICVYTYIHIYIYICFMGERYSWKLRSEGRLPQIDRTGLEK